MTISEIKDALKKARRKFRSTRRKRRAAKPGGERRERLAGLQRFWERRKRRLAVALKEARERLLRAPGPPGWNGCRLVTNRCIKVVAGRAPVTSRKRTYVPAGGSSTSEHLVWMVHSDAVDFGIGNAFQIAAEIRFVLTGVREHSEYEFFYFTYKDMRFRGQLIAGTHGTGPHLHAGFTRVG